MREEDFNDVFVSCSPGKAEMETYIQQLEGQKAKLEKEVSDLEVQCQMVEKKAVEQRQAEEKVLDESL